jgi:hypothetical protein
MKVLDEVMETDDEEEDDDHVIAESLAVLAGSGHPNPTIERHRNPPPPPPGPYSSHSLRDLEALRDSYKNEILHAQSNRRQGPVSSDELLRFLKNQAARQREIDIINEEINLRTMRRVGSTPMEVGSGIGKKRRRVDAKPARVLHPSARMNPWMVPDTESFFPEGGVMSGRLMSKRRDALPISAQIQVNEIHQLYEPGLKQYTRMPDVSENVTDEVLPIAQYSSSSSSSTKKSGLRGGPHVPFGKYLIDYGKLQGGTLSIKHHHGNKVVGWPNQQISKPMYNSIMSILHKGKPKSTGLKPHEKVLIGDLLNYSHSTVPRVGADINVGPREKLEIILGEIDAGNDNPALKSQLKKLLNEMIKRNMITAQHKDHITKEYL